MSRGHIGDYVKDLKPERNSQELDKGASLDDVPFSSEGGPSGLLGHVQWRSVLAKVKGEFIGRIPGSLTANVGSEA